MSQPSTGLQLRSTVTEDGVLEISLARVPVLEPTSDEVLVRVEASPINPSDLGLLLAGADVSTAKASATPEGPTVTAEIPKALLRSVGRRMGRSLPVGNEGAGVVIAAGASAEAQVLLGATVAILGGGMYAQYRIVKATECLRLPPGTTPAEGASCFVNPLTALAMVETMRIEKHSALVHTAAASNLGQMLNKLCIADGIGLVNIVRKREQVEILTAIGAKHVVNSGAPTFMDDLTEAVAATGATLAFDAIGGGTLASRIFSCMEAAASRTATEYNRYGSTVHKQIYIYGGLDRGPTELTRNFGTAWGIGGWLFPTILQRVGRERAQKLRERVAAEIKTTFASHYTKEVSLSEALRLEEIAIYSKQATGQKYLINPNKNLA